MKTSEAMKLRQRNVNTVVKAVSRNIAYGGDGRYFEQEFYQRRREAAAFRRSKWTEHTFDAQEMGNTRRALRIYGSVRAKVINDVLKLGEGS